MLGCSSVVSLEALAKRASLSSLRGVCNILLVIDRKMEIGHTDNKSCFQLLLDLIDFAVSLLHRLLLLLKGFRRIFPLFEGG